MDALGARLNAQTLEERLATAMRMDRRHLELQCRSSLDRVILRGFFPLCLQSPLESPSTFHHRRSSTHHVVGSSVPTARKVFSVLVLAEATIQYYIVGHVETTMLVIIIPNNEDEEIDYTRLMDEE